MRRIPLAPSTTPRHYPPPLLIQRIIKFYDRRWRSTTTETTRGVPRRRQSWSPLSRKFLIGWTFPRMPRRSCSSNWRSTPGQTWVPIPNHCMRTPSLCITTLDGQPTPPRSLLFAQLELRKGGHKEDAGRACIYMCVSQRGDTQQVVELVYAFRRT